MSQLDENLAALWRAVDAAADAPSIPPETLAPTPVNVEVEPTEVAAAPASVAFTTPGVPATTDPSRPDGLAAGKQSTLTAVTLVPRGDPRSGHSWTENTPVIDPPPPAKPKSFLERLLGRLGLR